MHGIMFNQLLRFFVVFLVVVEPVSLLPLFVGLTEGVDEAQRRQMARRAVLISAVILTVFAAVGAPFLKIMSISLESFRIFGGLLLFLIALEMVFARPPGTRTSTQEQQESEQRQDLSVFPLAFPFIAGPGALTTILLAFGGTAGKPALFFGLLLVVFVVLAITLAILYLAAPAMRVLGVTGTNVISRLFGVLLGALAVQFVIDGLRGSFGS
ncbi:MAG TPA: MarC family protein [Steroidobacteraceae bacterium]|nr:MarC family protein [Steroidobacteraceae bacterium]